MNRPRLRVLLPLGALGLLAAAGAAFVITHQDHSTALEPDAAVDAFRNRSHETPAPAADARRTAPEPGVYSYATTGFESTDVLSGARHDYPSVSTITYAASGCGSEDRWQPLTSRFSANVLCRTAAGLELRSTQQHREFFGRVQAQAFTCPAGFTELPATPVVGHRSSAVCRGTSGDLALSSRVLGAEVLAVGTSSLPVTHLELTGRLTGQTTGTISRDLWLDSATGLVVRVTGTADTRSDTLAGPARYTERYTLSLMSVSPRR